MSFLQDSVQILTQKNVSPGGKIQIDFPVVIVMNNPTIQLRINNEITSLIYRTVNNQISEYLKVGYKREQINITVSYEIKTNERGALSLAIHAYFFPVPAAHGITVLNSITMDINTAKVYQLNELFRPGINYIP